jgi:hypothetical protein
MNSTKSTLPREHNPETFQKHQKEVLWQITAPLIICVVVIILLMAVSVSPAVEQSLWADISLIWIILPNMVIALLMIVLLAGLIYGLIKLTGVMPYYAHKVQGFFNQVKYHTQKMDNRLVEPIVKGKAVSASVRKLFEELFQR